MFREIYLYYYNQGDTYNYIRKTMSQPSLNAATFHPTIQAKQSLQIKLVILPKDDSGHLEIPPAKEYHSP